jgi:hypothetical protein
MFAHCSMFLGVIFLPAIAPTINHFHATSNGNVAALDANLAITTNQVAHHQVIALPLIPSSSQQQTVKIGNVPLRGEYNVYPTHYIDVEELAFRVVG